MDYTYLGNTGMEVSQICLGCMGFGRSSSNKYGWTLDEKESKDLIERAIELGINFFDTANTYSWGDSEEILGSVLSDYDLDEFVVATKVYNSPMAEPHPNATGLSRKTIEQELENSLNRLNMDVIDLYQIHRWDYNTPIKQTLKILNDTIRRGKTRYIGASSMWTYQFAQALYTADSLNLDRFATMQNHYNLVYREEEREMLPFCQEYGIGVIPWSPMARGYLTRPHEEFDTTTRAERESDRKDRRHAIYRDGGGREINSRVEELANKKGVKMAQIALAWQLHKDWVDAPITGVTNIQHLEDAVEATKISLSGSEISYLEEPYEPVRITGHR